MAAAEVGGIIRRTRHELLARAEQLEAADLAFDARRLCRVGEAQERAVEDRFAGEWVEFGSVGGDFDAQLDRLAAERLDRCNAIGERATRAACVATQREPESILAVEARLRGADRPA